MLCFRGYAVPFWLAACVALVVCFKAMQILLHKRFSNEHELCKLVSGILWFLTNNAGYCLYTPVFKN
jgi:hypothetical protein